MPRKSDGFRLRSVCSKNINIIIQISLKYHLRPWIPDLPIHIYCCLPSTGLIKNWRFAIVFACLWWRRIEIAFIHQTTLRPPLRTLTRDADIINASPEWQRRLAPAVVVLTGRLTDRLRDLCRRDFLDGRPVLVGYGRERTGIAREETRLRMGWDGEWG